MLLPFDVGDQCGNNVNGSMLLPFDVGDRGAITHYDLEFDSKYIEKHSYECVHLNMGHRNINICDICVYIYIYQYFGRIPLVMQVSLIYTLHTFHSIHVNKMSLIKTACLRFKNIIWPY